MPRRTAPTLDDVAKVAGVSRATASRAVRGGFRVSHEFQIAIEAAVEQLGYITNQATRSLASRRSTMIAVVAFEPHRRVFYDPYFVLSVAAVAERWENTNQHMALHLSYGGYLRKFKQHLPGEHIDATIIISHHDREQLPAMLEAAGKPCLFLGRPGFVQGDGEGSSMAERYVGVDNVLGGRLVGQHLVEQGCRRIATITGDLDTASARDRLQGLKESLAEADLELVAVYPGTYDPVTGRTQVEALLASGVPFDGLFVASDHMAVSALTMLTERGIRVPEDVKLVGFDNAEISRITAPSLSTVPNPWEELARAATEQVLAELDGDPPSEPLILAPTLVPRQSTEVR